MSTRKSVNKQNSDSTISSSQDAPSLRSKQQTQDAGSESSEPPSTPTSKDSNQSNTADSKRKRRTNSIQSISTPKRSTSEAPTESTSDADKNTSKEIKEEKTTPPQSESPRTRKKATDKSNTPTTTTVSTRKSAAAEAALKNPPLRSSLRAKNNAVAKKNASPNETSGTPKTGARTRKKPDPASTPIKRERLNSIQSETDLEGLPDVKRIKIEKVEDEPEEEILMEIRTEILDEIRAKEAEVIEFKTEKPDSDVNVKDTNVTSEVEVNSLECIATPEKSEKNPAHADSKDDEVVIVIAPVKVVSVDDDDEIKKNAEDNITENHIRGEDDENNKKEDTANPKDDKPPTNNAEDIMNQDDEKKKEVASEKKEEEEEDDKKKEVNTEKQEEDDDKKKGVDSKQEEEHDNKKKVMDSKKEVDDDDKKKDVDSKKKDADLNVDSDTKRPTRRTATTAAATQGRKGKNDKKEAETPQPMRRARIQRAAAAAALTKTTTKKTPKANDSRTTKLSNKSPVPENTDESNSTKTQVPESIEDDEMSNSEPAELIFSTTTNPSNIDKVDQSHEPLIIDTSTQNSDGKDSIPSTECTAGSDKSASLSPVDLESEGVSAVSVKQFYKEPQFLENNLGIEKDPKLGGIVQTVDKEPELDINESISDVTTTITENSDDAEKASVVDTTKKEEQVDIDDKEEKIVLIVEPVVSDELRSTNVKTPEILDVNEESDLSDSIKEGELLLVLEESTEEENSLSQKTDVEESKTENITDLTENKKEEIPLMIIEDVKENPGTQSDTIDEIGIESKEEDLKKILTNEEIIQIMNQEIEIESKEEIPVKVLTNEEIIQIINPIVEKSKPACESNLVLVETESKDENKLETTQSTTQGEPEAISKSDCTAEMAEDEDMEKDVIENESTAMEIDSGVSDVAENNSNDPNEDLNLIHDIIGCVNQKNELSDGECVVSGLISSVSVDKKVDVDAVQRNIKALDVTPTKLYIPKDEKKDIPHITIKISETPETLKQKENHFKSLGLLSLKAADEAKIEKQRRRHQLNILTPSTSKKVNGNANTVSDLSSGSCSSSSSESSTNNGNGSSTSNESGSRAVQEYTGTLKTVIKLNRPTGTPIQSSDKKRYNNGSSNGQSSVTANSMALVPVTNSNVSGRMPLKITLQKGRGRGTHLERHANGSQHSTEHAYYTIQNESEAGTQENVTHGRKSHHYRFNIDPAAATEPAAADKKEVVIPEKASSFGIHPGRLCQDQCFYCGGKFGLYDTPCHVAQLKSLERQKRILENEEKLTVDNCLCDACFRHLDRRANSAAAQKKRISAAANIEGQSGENTDGGANESVEGGSDTMQLPPGHTLTKSVCFVTNCGQPASHTFRRKGFRKTIKKLLGGDVDLTNMGGRLPICDKHYEIIIQCLECALCKRRLIRNHMHHITQDVQLLESLLVKQGIPVKLQTNPAVCKLCRYFTNLLLKPPEGKTQKAQFVKNYRKRLLHFHNVQQSDEGSEADEQEETAEKSHSPAPVKRGRKPKPLQSSDQSQPQSTPATSEDGNSDEIVDLDAEPVQQTPAGSGQMQLDNDVMVDYDLPVMCDTPSPPAVSKPAQPQKSKLQAILQGGSIARSNDDISLVLRSNPNISMRELFPGEEDLGMQVNVPFGSSTSQRTPEGWTRVQTFLQYDEPTRRLWEDLQKPYGNQSSFLRHLILLEKYFRNGDLILSQNASTNAVAYSETVQNRLHSYDYSVSSPQAPKTNKNSATVTLTSASKSTNQTQQQQLQQKMQISSNLNTSNNSSANGNIGSNKVTGNSSRQAGMISVPDPIKKLHSNLTITITPKTRLIPETTQVSTPTTATSTSTTATTSGATSILKTNLLSRKNSAIEIIPISSGSNSSVTNTRPVMSSLTKQQKLLAAANQLMGEEKTSNSTNASMTSMSLANSQSQQKHPNFPPELISINRNNPNSLLIGGRGMFGGNHTSLKSKTHSNMHLPTHPQQSSNRPARLMPTVIKLPGILTAHERMTSKHWRPTLMPINSGPLRTAPGILYQTADGRRLPSLVQVQSGGKPYLISIHDYNRMCILRREKLMRDQLMKNGKNSGSSASSSGNSLLKGALSSTSSVNSSNTNSPSVSNVVSLSNSVSKSILSHGSKQW